MAQRLPYFACDQVRRKAETGIYAHARPARVPEILHTNLQRNELLVLIFGPSSAFEVWIQLVQPPFPALFCVAPEECDGDRSEARCGSVCSKELEALGAEANTAQSCNAFVRADVPFTLDRFCDRKPLPIRAVEFHTLLEA